MPEFEVLPEIDSYEERQRLANIAKIFTKAKNRDIPVTKEMASVLAATGLAGNAAAQPDRDDQYPEVGLVDNRVDGWADGVDANATYSRQLGQSIPEITTSTSYTVLPGNGNVQKITLTGGTTLGAGSVSGRDGCGMSLLIDADGSYGVSWGSSIVWPSNISPPGITSEHGFGIVGLRTYDGGGTWYATDFAWINTLYYEGTNEDGWYGTGSTGTTATKETDSLRLLVQTDEGDGGHWETTYSVDYSEYSYAEVEWSLTVSESVDVDLEVKSYDTGDIFEQRTVSSGFSRTREAFDISGVTGTGDFAVEKFTNSPSSGTVDTQLDIYSAKLYR